MSAALPAVAVWKGAAVVLAGVAAGFVNTLAGGGSLVSLPALLLLGLPANVANATNRVAVLSQSVSATADFARAGRLELRAGLAVAVPALLGAFAGAEAAAVMPEPALRKALLAAMLLIAGLLFARPAVLAPPPGTPARRLRERPLAAILLFLVGAYGGFVQAGVGLFLLASLSGLLRYDLVRANAIKSLVIAGFTALSLAVFIVAGQVLWGPGLLLSVGMVAGARLGVRFALARGHEALRRVVLAMAVATCIAAWLR